MHRLESILVLYEVAYFSYANTSHRMTSCFLTVSGFIVHDVAKNKNIIIVLLLATDGPTEPASHQAISSHPKPSQAIPSQPAFLLATCVVCKTASYQHRLSIYPFRQTTNDTPTDIQLHTHTHMHPYICGASYSFKYIHRYIHTSS